jgi:DNA-directed RNA polymerase specialized sigma24 family protein
VSGASASEQSFWFSTRSALFRPGDAAWQEVAAYEAPLRRFLERRYRWLADADRDDLVQDVLVEIKKTLARAHDRSRGKFRALLQTVVKRRVADRVRARRTEPLGKDHDGAAPSEEEIADLDLETRLLEAFARCRDRFTQGKDRDAEVLYALVDRVVHGHSSLAIARKNRVSVDQVARLLEKGRDAILESLVAGEVGVEGERLARSVRIFKETLRRPRARVRIIEKEKDPKLREKLDDLVVRFHHALSTFDGAELRAGVAFLVGRH